MNLLIEMYLCIFKKSTLFKKKITGPLRGGKEMTVLLMPDCNRTSFALGLPLKELWTKFGPPVGLSCHPGFLGVVVRWPSQCQTGRGAVGLQQLVPPVRFSPSFILQHLRATLCTRPGCGDVLSQGERNLCCNRAGSHVWERRGGSSSDRAVGKSWMEEGLW